MKVIIPQFSYILEFNQREFDLLFTETEDPGIQTIEDIEVLDALVNRLSVRYAQNPEVAKAIDLLQQASESLSSTWDTRVKNQMREEVKSMTDQEIISSVRESVEDKPQEAPASEKIMEGLIEEPVVENEKDGEIEEGKDVYHNEVEFTYGGMDRKGRITGRVNDLIKEILGDDGKSYKVHIDNIRANNDSQV